MRPYRDWLSNALELCLLSNALVGYVAAVGAEVAAAALQPAAGPSAGAAGQSSDLGRLVDAVRLAGTATVGAVLVYSYEVLCSGKGTRQSMPSNSAAGEHLLEPLMPEVELESADGE